MYMNENMATNGYKAASHPVFGKSYHNGIFLMLEYHQSFHHVAPVKREV